MTFQDILVKYGKQFLAKHNLSLHARKVFSAILHCRTAVMGTHSYVCDNCGHEVFVNNSCHDRHCPLCQTAAKEL
jgi:rubrerythrin